MMYLLDTNVISETIKKKPYPKLIQWLEKMDMTYFSLSVLTFGEIRKGIELLDNIEKKQTIIQWLEIELPKAFSGRIINIDQVICDKWGYISAITKIPAVDGLLAASALVHNQKLVTRNIKDFQNIPGLELINPWQ